MKYSAGHVAMAILGLALSHGVNAHEIVLISKSTSFNPALIINETDVEHSFGGTTILDDQFAIRLTFNTDYGGFIYSPMQSGSGSAQQDGYANFTLEWVPSDPSDVPAAVEYSLLVDVFVTLGSQASAAMPMPPAQIFLSATGQAPGSATQVVGMCPPQITDGATGIEWLNDLLSGRVLVQEDYPVTVVFEEQKDGRFIGTARYNAAYQSSFYHQSYGVFRGPFGQSVFCHVRAKAKECAGVSVELP